MPFNHAGNTANGNALGKCRSGMSPGYVSTLTGRTTGLRLYEVSYLAFRNAPVSSPRLDEIVKSMKKDDVRDLASGFRQPTDHDDRLGNLPVAPGAGVVYREYHLTGNAFAWPGFPRLVADIKNRRLFITPTHYDIWLENPATARTANVALPIAHTAVGARNPFYLLRSVRVVNDLFD